LKDASEGVGRPRGGLAFALVLYSIYLKSFPPLMEKGGRKGMECINNNIKRATAPINNLSAQYQKLRLKIESTESKNVLRKSFYRVERVSKKYAGKRTCLRPLEKSKNVPEKFLEF
jgi:hypothetical protein